MARFGNYPIRLLTSERNKTMPLSSGLVYDAAVILGLGEPSSKPLPKPVPGELIIRVGAWSFRDLCTAVTDGMDKEAREDSSDWTRVTLTPGTYRVRMPIPDSYTRQFGIQCRLLLPGEKVLPPTLAAAVLLCYWQQEHEYLLECRPSYVRCDEVRPDGYRVLVGMWAGKITMINNRIDDSLYGDVGLAGYREIV
jgi:hypothetical protein